MLFFLIIPFLVFSQSICKDTVLYDMSGNVTAGGKICDGKFHGLWINLYPNGKVRSEGKYFLGLLDSTWNFFDSLGNKILEISYKNGVKNGVKRSYGKKLILEENYKDGVLDGYFCEKYYNGKTRKCISVVDGRFNGNVIVYDSNGNVISFEVYKKGILILREDINGFDLNHNKHGKWKEFYSNGNVKSEIEYYHGKKHGYYKLYDKNGNLLKVEMYVNDSLVANDKSVKTHQIIRDYYFNGKIKIEGSYYNGIPDGIRREYDTSGNVVKSYVFDMGMLTFEGIIDFYGRKQGYCKEYDNGILIAEGKYVNDKKVGEWKFYNSEGKLIEKGSFVNGRPDGVWYSFYPSGKIQRIEHYDSGVLNGEFIEFNEDSSIMAHGSYVDGLEDGRWFYSLGDVYYEISYANGELNGSFKIYDRDSHQLIVLNNYSHGVLNGKQYYYVNGRPKLEAYYVNGMREGIWKYYDDEGTLFLKVTYKSDKEIAIDRFKLDEN